MFNFQDILNEGEQILYQGKANPKKVSKNIGGQIFVIIFMLVIQFMLIFVAEFDFSSIIFIAITLLFQGLCLYSIINILFLKNKKIADDLYCLTNIRALKYDINENKLSYGFLENYGNVYSFNVKDGYGDINMQIICDNNISNDNSLDAAKVLMKLSSKPNITNMPFMCFESVSNPDELVELIKSAKNSLNNRNNIAFTELHEFIAE